jgi:Malectin domain
VSPFVADMDFVGGTAVTNWTGAIDTGAVTSPAPQAVYRAGRYGASTYAIRGFAPGSSHTVRLHMCENFFTTAGSRNFNVLINGAAA